MCYIETMDYMDATDATENDENNNYCYKNVIKKSGNGKYNYNSSKFIKSKARIHQFDGSLWYLY
jgi:hypothetical protein